MFRRIVYPAALPQDTDILAPQRYAMVNDGYVAQAAVGSATVVDGLAASNSPTSLAVIVGPGAIFQQSVVDQSAFGSMPAELNPVMKIGVNVTSTTFNLSAPTTAGQAISYLIEAALAESDTSATVLPYYNAANPAVGFSGPAGGGAAQNTLREQTCSLQLKAGAPATAGTQAVPATDAGWVPLYVLTVNTGANQAQISVAPGAPFIGDKLPAVNAKIAGLQAAVAAAQAAIAAADAAIAAIRPGTSSFQVLNANPGAATFTAPWTGIYKITVTGGGGGGGGCTTTSAGGGGAAGGTATAYVQLTAGQQVQYVVGGGGAAGGADGSAGGTGGTSSFGPYLAASGGGAGAGGLNVGAGAGGYPGVGIAGQGTVALVFYGGAGSDAQLNGVAGGVGGASTYGGGARDAANSLEGASNGLCFGAGGGGAYGNTAHTGGTGGGGLAVVTEDVVPMEP